MQKRLRRRASDKALTFLDSFRVADQLEVAQASQYKGVRRC